MDKIRAQVAASEQILQEGADMQSPGQPQVGIGGFEGLKIGRDFEQIKGGGGFWVGVGGGRQMGRVGGSGLVPRAGGGGQDADQTAVAVVAESRAAALAHDRL